MTQGDAEGSIWVGGWGVGGGGFGVINWICLLILKMF